MRAHLPSYRTSGSISDQRAELRQMLDEAGKTRRYGPRLPRPADPDERVRVLDELLEHAPPVPPGGGACGGC